MSKRELEPYEREFLKILGKGFRLLIEKREKENKHEHKSEQQKDNESADIVNSKNEGVSQ